MNKKFKKALAAACAGILTVSSIAGFDVKKTTAAEQEDGYELFVALGGDKAESNDWGWGYDGSADVEGVTVTKETIKVGETKTVGLEFSDNVLYTWYTAPVMIAEGVTAAEFDCKVYIDGEEVTADLTKGDNWWYEQTGSYSKTEAIRVAGGYNEWGTQYISAPENFKKIEFEVTLKSISFDAATGEESTEEYDGFIAFGGDKAEADDWGYSYAGEDADGITATNGKFKAGETTTLSLEFESPVVASWYFAPVLLGENIVEVDADIKLFLDGEEVTLDLTKGDLFWYEQTGNYDNTHAVRLAGGYNEWGTQYCEKPAGFKKMEYQITINKIMVGAPDEGPTSALGNVDLDAGVYHAYLGFQTPIYSFRNAYDEPNYGKGVVSEDGIEYFNQITGWDEDNNAITVPGTFEDAEIKGNGTYTVKVTGIEFAEDEFASQDYFNMIFLSTDIPNTNEVEISDVVLKINGSAVSDVNAQVNEESVDALNVQVQNIYNPECATIGYYDTSNITDMEITFTVSGFNYGGDEDAATDDTTDDSKDDTTTTDKTEVKDEAKDDAKEDGGLSTGAIAGIVAAAVVVVGGGCGIALKKKKK